MDQKKNPIIRRVIKSISLETSRSGSGPSSYDGRQRREREPSAQLPVNPALVHVRLGVAHR